MFKRILVPTDGSDITGKAVDKAMRIGDIILIEKTKEAIG